MSKQSQREARQKEEEKEKLKHEKFLDTLNSYLKIFGELLPRNKELGPLTAVGVAGYEIALRHLSPEQLRKACEEGLTYWKFFPSSGEIAESWANVRKRQEEAAVSYGHSPSTHYDEGNRLSQEDLQVINEAFATLAEKLSLDNVIKQKARQERKATELEIPSVELIPTVNGVPLTEWALNQDLSDDLPRTPQEIELIKSVKQVNKRKGKRSHYVRQP
jgi:hypothetical protein